MNRVLFIAVMAMWGVGCTSNHPSLDQKSNTLVSNNMVVVPHNCISSQDVKLHVFHSMYADQKSAEDAYSKITATPHDVQFFQLMAVARAESIDITSRDKGGDLGYIRIATFDKSFATAVFHLPLKRLSHPIQSKFGWHLVWVSDALDIKTNMPCE